MNKLSLLCNFVNIYSQIEEKKEELSITNSPAKRVEIFHLMEDMNKIEDEFELEDLDIIEELAKLRERITLILSNEI